MKRRSLKTRAINTESNYSAQKVEIEKSGWLNGIRKVYLIALIAMLVFIVDYHLPRRQSIEIFEKEYLENVVRRSQPSSSIMLVKTDKRSYASEWVKHKQVYGGQDLRGEVLHVQQTPILRRRISFDSTHLKYEASGVSLYLIYINFGVMLIGFLLFSKGTQQQGLFLFVMIIITITLLALSLYI